MTLTNPCRCKQTIYKGTWARASQCSRKATKDGYCKQHHPDAVAKRNKEVEERYEAKRKQSPWYKLKQAHDKIATLEADKARLDWLDKRPVYMENFTRAAIDAAIKEDSQ